MSEGWSSFQNENKFMDKFRSFAKGAKGAVVGAKQAAADIKNIIGSELDDIARQAGEDRDKQVQALQARIAKLIQDSKATGANQEEREAAEARIKVLQQVMQQVQDGKTVQQVADSDAKPDASSDKKPDSSGVDLSRLSKDPATALQQAQAILNDNADELAQHLKNLRDDKAISNELYNHLVRKGQGDSEDTLGKASPDFLVTSFIQARYGRAATAGTKAERARIVLTLAANMAPNKQFQSVFQKLANRVSALFKEGMILTEVGQAADMFTSMAYYLDKNPRTWSKKAKTQTKPETPGKPETAITTRTDGTPTTTGGGEGKPGQQKLLPLNIFIDDVLNNKKTGQFTFIFDKINRIQPPEDKQYIIFHTKLRDEVNEKIDVSELDLLHPDHEDNPDFEKIIRRQLPKIQAYINKKVAEIKDQISPEAVEALTDYLYGFDKKEQGQITGKDFKQIGTQERYPFSELLEQAREAEVKDFDVVFSVFTEEYRKQLGDKQSGEAQALIQFIEQVSGLIESNSREDIKNQIAQFEAGKYDDLGYGDDKDNPVTVIKQILDILVEKLGEPEEEGPEFIYFFDTQKASAEYKELENAWNSRFKDVSGARFKTDLKKFADFVGPYINFDEENNKAIKLTESNRFRKELKKFASAAPGYFTDDNEFTGALIKRVETDKSTKRIMLALLKLSGGRFVRESIRGVLAGLIANLRRRKNEKQVQKESITYDRMKVLAGIK